jgi:superfamily II DNA or RNA helicase
VQRATEVLGLLEALFAVEPAVEAGAAKAIDVMREQIVQRQLGTIPVARLKETTQGRLRIPTLEAAGYRTLAAVLAAGPHQLQRIPGVGEKTAAQIVGAARQLAHTLRANARIRFDADGRPPSDLATLQAIRAVELCRGRIVPLEADARRLARALETQLPEAQAGASKLRSFFAGKATKERRRGALVVLASELDRTLELQQRVADAVAILRAPVLDAASQWADYESRSVAYNSLLIEIGGLEPDQDASQGHLPAEIVQRVNEQTLDTSLLKVSLRGYQSFGARFALVQRRSILGDEMGLGKTIEALAVICHLHAKDERHALVVCPASVLFNWSHEIRRHTQLQPWRIHGGERRQALDAWVKRGGVGITTYESLKAIAPPPGMKLAVLVVDEAHYAKNPQAKRTQAVVRWSSEADRVLFMSGTPMENRVEEFKNLVGHLQPDVARQIRSDAGLAGAQLFRSLVAPVYLRRNQEDVLTELPPRIDMHAWVAMEGADLASYRDAVFAGAFMRMRRAAYEPRSIVGSAKLARLVEIVDEAAANGQKVVVFSYFRDVLHAVAEVLGDRVMGPLDGSMPPIKRQALVDAFSSHPDHKVLVSQIEAGGVGLNIQAASVVILAEPQWKPTIEDQAIARCHRMGQARRVEVHRLLAEGSVDERMLEILAGKSELFREYARVSSVKEASPDAVDVSDVDAAKGVVSQAEAERRIIEAEQRRLASAHA